MTVIRKEILKTKGYHLDSPRHRIKLNQNESPHDLPPPLKERAIERLRSLSWNRYPSPFCDSLREKIAAREGVDARGVVVAGGSNVLIQAIIIAAASKGKILTVTPGFSLYEIEASLFGNWIIKVPLSRDDFSLPRDLVLKKIKAEKPQIVFLSNPNAPTGNLFAEDDLIAIIKVSKGLVVIDEAYYPFSGATLLPHLKRYKNLIVLRTFSKAFSLGGVRLGYLLADPKIAAEILKVVLPFSVGVLSQAVGEVVLEDSSFVDSLVAEIIEEREKLYRSLTKIPGIRAYPSKTNFILFTTPRSRQLFQQLLKAGILIRDVSSKDLPNALRVTVGTKEENQAFLNSVAFPQKA